VSISTFEAARRGSLVAVRFSIRPVPVLPRALPFLVCLLSWPLEAKEAVLPERQEAAPQAQEASPPPDAIELPEVTVSATATPEPLPDVGSSVTVIDSAQIERPQRRTVPDALSLAPGLNVVQSGGPGGQTSVFIRGTNSNQVKVLIDGIDASDPSNPNGSFDFGQLLTYDIARIEVLRGPQSGLYGADAIGGVISITTKAGEGPPKTKALIEGGSFGTLNETMGFSGSTPVFSYYMNLAHFDARRSATRMRIGRSPPNSEPTSPIIWMRALSPAISIRRCASPATISRRFRQRRRRRKAPSASTSYTRAARPIGLPSTAPSRIASGSGTHKRIRGKRIPTRALELHCQPAISAKLARQL
jgi:outer membrane receptor protein involved in Fe transport